jgi:catechol 1,2-dioxygenase
MPEPGTASVNLQEMVGNVVASPRVLEVVAPVIEMIREQIRSQRVTYDEWHAAIRYMMELADAGEIPLAMDVFFEATVDAVSNADSSSSSSAIEGPYYVPGAPLLQPPCVMPQRPDEPGEPLVFTGQVNAADGTPLAGVLLDVWHADANVPGTYSNCHPGQPDFNLRGRLYTDLDGRFELRTIKPAPYPIPDQGPTGSLLNALGRHSWRPAHIHIKASAKGYHPLTTQLYFADGEFLDSDSASAVKDELVLPLERTGHNGDGHLVLRYEFRLEPTAA